jgi:methylated-DNA-[protein]-cysteine S-methyltransferase
MTQPTRLLFDHLETPVGRLTLVADEEGRLRAVGWFDGRVTLDGKLGGPARELPLVERSNPGGLTAALRAYFAGDLTAIDGLPVVLEGTQFQRRVWRALREIPCGQTWSYGKLARRVGNAGAARAVGLANNRNPIGIVVPCHRVIGADGSLTGYGGGIERKRWLLSHEGCAGSNLELSFA